MFNLTKWFKKPKPIEAKISIKKDLCCVSIAAKYANYTSKIRHIQLRRIIGEPMVVRIKTGHYPYFIKSLNKYIKPDTISIKINMKKSLIKDIHNCIEKNRSMILTWE